MYCWVTRDFGAFIEITDGQDGLCQISELDDGYVKNVTDVVKIGDMVKVKVILIDDTGRIKLSRKQAMRDEKGDKGGDGGRDDDRGPRDDDRGPRDNDRGPRDNDRGPRNGERGGDRGGRR